MNLTNSRRKSLRALGHRLKPIITIAGNGLTEGVAAEVERALSDHELIKLKLQIDDPGARRELASRICDQHGATLVQTVGKVALILREARQPNPKLSNLQRPIPSAD